MKRCISAESRERCPVHSLPRSQHCMKHWEECHLLHDDYITACRKPLADPFNPCMPPDLTGKPLQKFEK